MSKQQRAGGKPRSQMTKEISEPGNSADVKRRVRNTFWFGAAAIGVFLVSTSLLLVYGPGADGLVHDVWVWFTSIPTGVDSTALVAIASVAVVVWTGGLIAFTISQRYSADLSNGMWMLVLGFTAPLVGLAMSGAALRMVAGTAALAFGTVALLQIPALLSLRRMAKNKPLKLSGKVAFADGSAVPIPEQEQQQMLERYVDAMNRVILGALFTSVATLMSLCILAYASTTTVAVWSLLLLLRGLLLVYDVLTKNYRLGDTDTGVFVLDPERAKATPGAEGSRTPQRPEQHPKPGSST
jgi:hypothetical protein